MRFRSLFGLGLLALCLFALLPQNAAAQSVGPINAGGKLCVIDFSQGTTFAAYGSADLKDASSTANAAAACPTNWYLSACTVLNTHATQTVTVALANLSGAGPSASNRPLVPALQSMAMPTYGIYTQKIAVRGSGAATTGQIQCYAVPR